MKRTLTAAATLLVGTASAVSFAGTAAADDSQSRFQVADNTSLDETVHSATGTVHHHEAQQAMSHDFFGTPYYGVKTVGEVVPLTQPVTSRVAQKLTPPPEGPNPRVATRAAAKPPVTSSASQGEPGQPGEPGTYQTSMPSDGAMDVVANATQPAQQYTQQLFTGAPLGGFSGSKGTESKGRSALPDAGPVNGLVSGSPVGQANDVVSQGTGSLPAPAQDVLGKGNLVENVVNSMPASSLNTGSTTNNDLDGPAGVPGQSVLG